MSFCTNKMVFSQFPTLGAAFYIFSVAGYNALQWPRAVAIGFGRCCFSFLEGVPARGFNKGGLICPPACSCLLLLAR